MDDLPTVELTEEDIEEPEFDELETGFEKSEPKTEKPVTQAEIAKKAYEAYPIGNYLTGRTPEKIEKETGIPI